MGNYSVTIDGPAGAGKSTISKLIAKELKLEYIDTGAMYRAITLKILKKKVNIDSIKEVKNILGNTVIDFKDNHIYIDFKEVDFEIRSLEVTKKVSEVAKNESIREKLVELQRKIAKNKSIIMDGRDIGTNVLKDAKYKFYLNASIEERARRRYEEIVEKTVSFEEVKRDIEKRDREDSSRKISPLKKAVDSLEIDTTNMNTTEVVNFIVKRIREFES